MLPRLDSIRTIRTKLGITQRELARTVGVSTSMINQIESGRSRPSYETAKKIFDSLGTLEGRASSHRAGDFCSRTILRLKPSSTLDDAIKVMRKHSISQIPVFDDGDPIGLVSEDSIIEHLTDVGNKELNQIRVRDVMDVAPPIVDHDTPANVLVPLIRFSKCILVSKKSRIVGIITASDTLKMME